MYNRKAFTLLEVLISIALMGIVIVALFSSVDMLQNSNQHLGEHLKKSKIVTKTVNVLYADLMGSDGNITIQKDEFSRICMEETQNSLYALPVAKVCWIVLKKDNTLIRIEGNDYHVPLLEDEKVEVDLVMSGIKVFDIYHEKDKILVLMQQKGKEPISFMLQGISKPTVKAKAAPPHHQ
jgi:prepilin-type N-terminal cleavage/methylation domain-containing protein